MTFSIVARSSDARLYGVAVASSSPAVGARCAHARAGVGAVATQNLTDPALGPLLLDALQRGASAADALEQALRTTEFGAYRQLLVIGRSGAPAAHTGENALGTVGATLTANAAAAGNLLADPGVPFAMIAAYETPLTPSPASPARALASALLAALQAGARAGGEAGPIHSAAVLLVRDLSWPIVDLRIDWSDVDPIAELTLLWERYAPQVEDYVLRALQPERAPRFGMPEELRAIRRSGMPR